MKLIDIGLYILDTLRGEQHDNKIKVPNGDTFGLQYTHSQRILEHKTESKKNSSSCILSHFNDVASFYLSFPQLAK